MREAIQIYIELIDISKLHGLVESESRSIASLKFKIGNAYGLGNDHKISIDWFT